MSTSAHLLRFWRGEHNGENPLFNSFAECLARNPELCPATYSEENSFCLDILTLSHNAARQELSDMYMLCRAMGDLGNELTVGDVKVSTLWFRSFYKFLSLCVIEWHTDELFPWFCKAVDMKGQRCMEMARIYTQHQQVSELARVVYAKQGKVSTELSKNPLNELIQVQFVDAVCGMTDLAFHLAGYFRSVETFMAPALVEAGIRKKARDEMFSRMVIRMHMEGTERMHLPMLVRWMPRALLKQWLKEYAVDVRGKRIPTNDYNTWLKRHFYELHQKLVEDMVKKAKAV